MHVVQSYGFSKLGIDLARNYQICDSPQFFSCVRLFEVIKWTDKRFLLIHTPFDAKLNSLQNEKKNFAVANWEVPISGKDLRNNPIFNFFWFFEDIKRTDEQFLLI
jgi:hypothetical protein